MSAVCPLPVLVQSVRAAARCAQDHSAAPMQELSASLTRVLSRLERPCVEAARLMERLRDTLLALTERQQQLRLRLHGDAGLRRAEPRRAQSAEAALGLLPLASESELHEETQALCEPELSAELCLRVLSAAQALLSASQEPPVQERVAALDLEPLLEALRGLRAQGATLAAQWVAARDRLAEHDDEPELDHEEAAAVGLLVYYRAYALLSTGPLARHGDEPARRQALLAPLRDVPMAALVAALNRYEALNPASPDPAAASRSPPAPPHPG